MLKDFLLVGAGGFLGSIARYSSSLFLRQWWPAPAPWPTLAINVTGCFLIGLLWGYLVARTEDPRSIALFLSTGVLGGFTTFSAFGIETLDLLQSGATGTAAVYVAASLLLGLGAVTLGRLVF